MRAIQFSQPGNPEVLEHAYWASFPAPVANQLLIQLKAAGVNPIDTKIRQRGTFFPDQMPAVLGCDGAGVVTAAGPDAHRFGVGDAVYFCHGGLGDVPGTYCEYALVPESVVAPKPTRLSFAEAAAAPLVLITAWEALFDRVQLKRDQTVLIQAGAGGVGHVAIQLAKQVGARVFTTVSSAAKADFVTDLGADGVINYRTTDVVAAVMQATNGSGVDVSFDPVGSLSQCFAATTFGGSVVTLLAPAAETDWKTARSRNLQVGFELMLTPQLQNMQAAQEHQAQILEQCQMRFDRGELHIHLEKTFPLAAAADAHLLLEQGSMTGKIALLIDS